MSTSDLQLTHKELELIMGDDWHDDRFKVLEDDIPKDGHSSQYIEDDGRQYRSFQFEDTHMGKMYQFGYTWHHEYPVEVPLSLFSSTVEGIVFVKESVLVPKPEPVKLPASLLSPVQQADKDLWATYTAMKNQTSMNEVDLKKIPKIVLKDVLDLMRSKKFTFIDVRAKLVPIMIEYKLHDQMLWTHIQQKLGHWKKLKKA